jgi:hypothetical protein
VVQGAIPVIEYTDTVPQLGILLGVGEEVQRLLISGVSLLQIILHEITMPERAPYFAVVFL